MVVALHANHELLDSPMVGMGLAFRIAKSERTTLRFGLAGARNTSRRTGVVCAGLMPPGSCPEQPIEDHGRLGVVSLGFERRAARKSRIELGLVGDVSAGMIRVQSRGMSNGQSLTGNKVMIGIDIGARGSVPVPRVPARIFLEGSVGVLGPLLQTQIEDGYTPFEDGFRTARLTLGLSWPRP